MTIKNIKMEYEGNDYSAIAKDLNAIPLEIRPKDKKIKISFKDVLFINEYNMVQQTVTKYAQKMTLKNIKIFSNHKGLTDILQYIESPLNKPDGIHFFGIKHVTDLFEEDDLSMKLISKEYFNNYTQITNGQTIYSIKICTLQRPDASKIKELFTVIKNNSYFKKE